MSQLRSPWEPQIPTPTDIGVCFEWLEEEQESGKAKKKTWEGGMENSLEPRLRQRRVTERVINQGLWGETEGTNSRKNLTNSKTSGGRDQDGG